MFIFCFIAHIFLYCIDSLIYKIPRYAICLSPTVLCYALQFPLCSFDKIRFKSSALPIFTPNFPLRTDGFNARQIYAL